MLDCTVCAGYRGGEHTQGMKDMDTQGVVFKKVKLRMAGLGMSEQLTLVESEVDFQRWVAQ